MKIFGIVGWKNAGKTTLVCEMVAELRKRGLSVATIKHAHHAFDIDHPGTDSYKHREAGAEQTVLVSSARVAVMRELPSPEDEPSLGEALSALAPCDFVLVEGFKREGHPKLEVLGAEAAQSSTPVFKTEKSVLAVASESAIDVGERPVFKRRDINQIVDFALAHAIEFRDLKT